MFRLKSRETDEMVSSMSAQLAELHEHQIILERDLGTSDATKIVARVRELEQRVQELQQEPPAEVIVDSGANPKEIVARLGEFVAKVRALNETVTSLEDQLATLYAEREVLERKLGHSDAKEILSLISSLESQLMTMYAGREILERELGTSDGEQIVAMVQKVRTLSESISRAIDKV